MSTKIDDLLICSSGIEIGPIDTQNNNTVSSNPNNLLLYNENGALKIVDNNNVSHRLVTEPSNPPSQPPVPTPSTVYGMCLIQRDLGIYGNKEFDTSGWFTIVENGVIGTWYQIIFESCQANGITTNMSGQIIQTTGIYMISLEFGGNFTNVNKPQVVTIAISTNGSPPPQNNYLTSFTDIESSNLDLPFTISSKWILPLYENDIIQGYIKAYDGEDNFDIKLYHAQLLIQKI